MTTIVSSPGNYGIKVAKEGFDVTTSQGREVAFSSSRYSFKAYLSGTTQLAIPATGAPTRTIATITHNIGRITPHTVFIDTGFYTPEDPIGEFEQTASQINASNLYATAYADENNLYLVVQDSVALGLDYTAEFRWFIFLD